MLFIQYESHTKIVQFGKRESFHEVCEKTPVLLRMVSRKINSILKYILYPVKKGDLGVDTS